MIDRIFKGTPHILVSESTLNKIVSLGLSLGKPTYWYHQTLTITPKVYDPHEVKKRVKKLLDRLEKKFEMVTLYVIEHDQSLGLHIHALFCFYDGNIPIEAKEINQFEVFVFKAWNSINGGGLARRFNQTKTHNSINPTYLIKQARTKPRKGKKTRKRVLWWGCRNKDLLNQHAIPVDRAYVKWVVSHYKASKRFCLSHEREALASSQSAENICEHSHSVLGQAKPESDCALDYLHRLTIASDLTGDSDIQPVTIPSFTRILLTARLTLQSLSTAIEAAPGQSDFYLFSKSAILFSEQVDLLNLAA